MMFICIQYVWDINYNDGNENIIYMGCLDIINCLPEKVQITALRELYANHILVDLFYKSNNGNSLICYKNIFSWYTCVASSQLYHNNNK